MDLCQRFPLKTINDSDWRQAIVNARRKLFLQPLITSGISGSGDRYLGLCGNIYIQRTSEGLIYSSLNLSVECARRQFPLLMHQHISKGISRFRLISQYLKAELREICPRHAFGPEFTEVTEMEWKENHKKDAEFVQRMEGQGISPLAKKYQRIYKREVRPTHVRSDQSKVYCVAKILDKMTFPKKLHGPKHLIHIFAKKVREQLFDEETYRLSIRLRGFRADSDCYNLISENLGEVSRLASTSPSIVAAWVGYKLAQIDLNQRIRSASLLPFDPDVLEDKSQIWQYFDPETYYTNSIPGEFKAYLQKGLLDDHVSRIWKYICRLKPSWARVLFRDITPCHYHGRMLYVFALVQEVPRLRTYARAIAYFLKEAVDTTYEKVELTATILRKVFRESYRRKGKKALREFWEEEVSLVMDWMSRSDVYHLNHTQKKAPWAWFVEQSKKWSRNQPQKGAWPWPVPYNRDFAVSKGLPSGA